MNEKLTEEQKIDAETRIEEFMKQFEELTKTYQVDLAAFPSYVPQPNGTFITIVNVQPMDTKYLQMPSPFTQKK